MEDAAEAAGSESPAAAEEDDNPDASDNKGTGTPEDVSVSNLTAPTHVFWMC